MFCSDPCLGTREGVGGGGWGLPRQPRDPFRSRGHPEVPTAATRPTALRVPGPSPSAMRPFGVPADGGSGTWASANWHHDQWLGQLHNNI